MVRIPNLVRNDDRHIFSPKRAKPQIYLFFLYLCAAHKNC